MARGEVIKNLVNNGGEGGVVIVTVPDPAADVSPDSQEVTSCLVAQKAGTQAYMNFDEAVVPATMATSTDWKLSTTPIPVPVHNLDQLHFSGTAGDLIMVLWRK